MSVLIEWEEPQSVADFEWRTKYAPMAKGIQRTCCIFVGAISLPILWAVWIYAPSGLLVTCAGLFFGIVFPVGLSIQLQGQKTSWRCRISQKNLCKLQGLGSFWSTNCDRSPFKWSEIKKYEFIDHPELHHIRQLVFSLKGLKPGAIFNFDPGEVDEQRLRSVLEERLPEIKKLG